MYYESLTGVTWRHHGLTCIRGSYGMHRDLEDICRLQRGSRRSLQRLKGNIENSYMSCTQCYISHITSGHGCLRENIRDHANAKLQQEPLCPPLMVPSGLRFFCNLESGLGALNPKPQPG